ncbi:hypothetical protein [Mucilaginibacter terrae]|uniref:Outer membrane protein beta-barrel domain-containing protein n=1 Tax=Mucilaginibacter terrae TaxID=1955052 RepID=A0ABU3GYV6_9SPHI|nr:hypothetical protein [Mucilaginibacter terrae]MDT3404956.1 hypothetical protein [Mucilaginibacter terrae]
MKKLTKIVAAASFAVATLFASNVVKAQSRTAANDWRLGIGVEAGVPTGNAHDGSNFALGGTARLQYGAAQNVALTLTSGFYNFFGKEIGNTNFKTESLGVIPVKAGIKAYTTGGFYFSGEVGAGFETKSRYLNGDKDTKLILSPGVGYSWSNVDLGVRYENFSGQSNNYGMVAARLAYGFKL